MDKKDDTIYIIGHKNPDTDSICSAIAYSYLKNKNTIAARAGEINQETRFVLDYFNIKEPYWLKDATGKKIILVDHSETSQSPYGINDSEILEIIDHHRIGDIQTGKPIFFHCEPIGCTATIIANWYFNNCFNIDSQKDIELPKEIAGILLAAILSDTVIFKSPTCTDKDIETANKLSEITGIDIKEFGIKMFKVKSDIANKSALDILKGDFKDFDFDGNKVGIGQIELMDLKEIANKKPDLIKEMQKLKEKDNYVLITLMVTEILNQGTDLLFVGNKEIIENAFNKKVETNSVYLDGVLSRKKQVVPPIEKVFRSTWLRLPLVPNPK